MEDCSEPCRGRLRGAQPQEVRAVPERQDVPHSHALRPRLLLALHRRLAQPEAGMPAVPVSLHDLGACLRVPQRLLARMSSWWGLFWLRRQAGHCISASAILSQNE